MATESTGPPTAPEKPAPKLPNQHRATLHKAWTDGNLVLCLGAGVSLPYGLPSWNDLVLTLLLDEYPSKFRRLWEHYRRPFGSWLAETFGLNPMQLARLSQRKYVLQGGQNFPQYVRDQLREELRPASGETAIEAIADLLVESEGQNRRVQYVITLNFDDLLERELVKRGIKVHPIYGPNRRDGSGLIIVHPHGYLPLDGNVPDGGMVFSEQQYHELSYSNIHWAQVEMLSALRCFTVVFIGLSMSDPNLRRFLDATVIKNSLPTHFLFRKTYSLTEDEKETAARTITDRVLAQVAAGQEKPEIKDPLEFKEAIDDMLKVPRAYDEELFRDMGVEVIWYKDHNDVPHMVRDIATNQSR